MQARRGGYRVARLIGYARVSADDQNLHLPLDALKQAGCSDEKLEDTIGIRPQDRWPERPWAPRDCGRRQSVRIEAFQFVQRGVAGQV